jgi:hypothetical protein
MQEGDAVVKPGKQKANLAISITFSSTNANKGPYTTLAVVEGSVVSSIRSQTPSQCKIFVGGSRGGEK